MKRQAVWTMVEEHGLSIERACSATGLSRAAYYYQPRVDRVGRDSAVIDALRKVVDQHPRWGFWKCFDHLRFNDFPWNHKRVHRIYCKLGLNIPRRTRRRVERRMREPLVAPQVLNDSWSIDFMTDRLYDGRSFRTLNVLDEGNREGLAIDIGTSLPSARVIKVLEELVAMHGLPRALRLDNGPEFTASVLTEWSKERGIALKYIQPGKPSQNAFIERFNRSYRTEVLDSYAFNSLEEVREITTDWLHCYNNQRPHDSLGRVPPLTFLPRSTTMPEKSTLQLSA